VRFRWSVFSIAEGSASVIRGGKDLAGDTLGGDQELLGWESPTYGERCPAISLLYRVQAPLPVRIVSAILASEALQLQQDDCQLVLSCDNSQIYQLSLTPVQTVGAGG